MEPDLHRPGPAALLHAWERGHGLSPTHQALLLLAAACPQRSFRDLAALPIGRRDRLLLHLRGRLFGPHLDSLLVCPECGERLELTVDVGDVEASPSTGTTDEGHLETGECTVRFRLPNSLDLIAAGSEQSHEQARLVLLQNCVLEARFGDTSMPPADLPVSAQTAIVDRLSALDPQADVRFSVDCPLCHHAWMAIFDIVTFLWQEVHDWAVRILDEVHTLATAYGWTESDILALSNRRRRQYLDMVTG